MQKIENAVIVEKTDTFTDIVRELCDNTSDANELLKVLIFEFPELENKPQQQNECVNKMCYVSDSFNFDLNFNHDDFINELINNGIYKQHISEYGGLVFIDDTGWTWHYAMPCDNIKVEIIK